MTPFRPYSICTILCAITELAHFMSIIFMIPKFGVCCLNTRQETPNQFEQMTLQGRERRQTHKNALLNRRYRKYCIVRFVQAQEK